MSLNLATIIRGPAASRPDTPALLAGDAALSYDQLHAAARRFAGGLSRLGIGRGRHVALLLPNVPQFAIAYYGAHYLGAPVVPINVLLTTDEILYHLDDSGAAVLVVWQDYLAQARAAAARSATCRRLIVAAAAAAAADDPGLDLNRDELGMLSMEALAGGADPVDEAADTMPDDTAVILYTSGTTGRPKGAELTHFNLFSNADCLARALALSRSTVGLCALPLFHSFGQTVMLNAVLMRGGAVALMRRFDADAALDLMQRHAVTFFAGVPTMYFALRHHSGREVPSLETCLSGGAPMPVEVMKAFDERYGVSIIESYGLSETSPVASINPLDRPKKPGSIGVPIEGVEFKLIDDAGRDIDAAAVPGEICIKGHNIMKGYHAKPEATAEALRNGWFRTGDVAVRDGDGYYFIVDRKKDMILRGGYNVYPREIEEVLYAHPAVREAAVVGVPHPRHGEEVRAIVALKPGASATSADIISYCREHLAAYKYPRIVEFRDELPKGPTGKILKRALRG